MASLTNQSSVRPPRRHDIDWLRVLGMGAVFVFHCARFFDADDWHVKNGVLSEVATVWVRFSVQWMMPLFFLLSGISSWYSLGSRPASTYLASRVKRLLIPFLFGTFIVLIPVQVWIDKPRSTKFVFGDVEFAATVQSEEAIAS